MCGSLPLRRLKCGALTNATGGSCGHCTRGRSATVSTSAGMASMPPATRRPRRYAITVSPKAETAVRGVSLRLALEVVRPAVDTAPLPDASARFVVSTGTRELPGRLASPRSRRARRRGDRRAAEVVASGERPINARLIARHGDSRGASRRSCRIDPGRTLPGNAQYTAISVRRGAATPRRDAPQCRAHPHSPCRDSPPALRPRHTGGSMRKLLALLCLLPAPLAAQRCSSRSWGRPRRNRHSRIGPRTAAHRLVLAAKGYS